MGCLKYFSALKLKTIIIFVFTILKRYSKIIIKVPTFSKHLEFFDSFDITRYQLISTTCDNWSNKRRSEWVDLTMSRTNEIRVKLFRTIHRFETSIKLIKNWARCSIQGWFNVAELTAYQYFDCFLFKGKILERTTPIKWWLHVLIEKVISSCRVTFVYGGMFCPHPSNKNVWWTPRRILKIILCSMPSQGVLCLVEKRYFEIFHNVSVSWKQEESLMMCYQYWSIEPIKFFVDLIILRRL